MPAVICYLHITLLDFKVNIAGGLKPAMEIQNQQPPQPDGDNPRYPVQTRASFLSDHVGTVWKNVVTRFTPWLETSFWKWGTHLNTALNQWKQLTLHWSRGFCVTELCQRLKQEYLTFLNQCPICNLRINKTVTVLYLFLKEHTWSFHSICFFHFPLVSIVKYNSYKEVHKICTAQ